MGTLKDITTAEEPLTITLNGRERELKLGMRACAEIEKVYGGMDKLIADMKSKPMTAIPSIIYLCLRRGPDIDNSDITEDSILDSMDRSGYNLADLKDIVTELMERAFPTGVAGNPPKAE